MKRKNSIVVGLIIGLVFGLLITVIHENYSEIANFLNIDTRIHSPYDSYSNCPPEVTRSAPPNSPILPACPPPDNTSPILLYIFLGIMGIIQVLYVLPLLPISVLGDYSMYFFSGDSQYFLVVIGYSVLGLIIGCLHQVYKEVKTIKNKGL
ncbi:MAG: hypothetical protein V4664_01430 [Patescibacteria group bacterium]